jgi:rRNA maturation endonuclease Nob1
MVPLEGLSMFKLKKPSISGRKKRAHTVFSTRPEHAIVCPGCGIASPRELDFCSSCGTMFIFLDETNRFCG